MYDPTYDNIDSLPEAKKAITQLKAKYEKERKLSIRQSVQNLTHVEHIMELKSELASLKSAYVALEIKKYSELDSELMAKYSIALEALNKIEALDVQFPANSDYDKGLEAAHSASGSMARKALNKVNSTFSLSNKDRDLLLESLENPPEPTEALKNLFKEKDKK